MSNPNIDYISLHSAAKLTDYSQDYISLLCRRGKIKGVKMGRNWVTTRKWVENYINETKNKGYSVIPVRIKAGKKPCDNQEELSVFLVDKKKEKSLSGGYENINNPYRICQSNRNKTKVYSMNAYSDNIIRTDNKKRSTFASGAKIAGAVFLSGVFFVAFIFLNNQKLLLTNQIFDNSNEVLEYISSGVNSMSGLFDVFFDPKKEKGIVAGIETFNNEGDGVAKEKGLVVVPIEENMDLNKKKELIENINLSFSDDVDIDPSDDGATGTINPKNNPEEKYLYLMVPVQ